MMQAHRLHLQESRRVFTEAPLHLDAKAQADAQMMLKAQEDLEGFGALYEAYFQMIYAYCRRHTGSRQEAEDISSQVFIRALEGIHTYRGGMVAAWLYRIARNEIATYYRRNRYDAVPIDTYDPVDDQQDFVEGVEWEATRQTLDKLVSELPPEQQKLLALSLEQGMTSPQIGRLLRQSPITVRTRLRRIKRGLQVRYLTVTREHVSRVSN